MRELGITPRGMISSQNHPVIKGLTFISPQTGHLDFFCCQWKGASEVPPRLALPHLSLVLEWGAVNHWLVFLDKLHGHCPTAPCQLDWVK